VERQTGGALEIAGFWPRLGGLLVDGCLFGFVVTVSVLIAGTAKGEAALWFCLAFLFIVITSLMALWGQTPGMALCGVRAVSLDGRRPGWIRACFRSVGFILSHFLYFGFLVALFNRDRRTFHDFLAKTRVVRDDHRSPSKNILRSVGVLSLALFPLAIWLRLRIPSVDRMLTPSDEPTAGQRVKQLSVKLQRANNLQTLGNMRERLIRQTNGWKQAAPLDIAGFMTQQFGEFPEASLPNHAPSRVVTTYGVAVCPRVSNEGPVVMTDLIKDTGGWGYISAAGSNCDGHLFFDCTHMDERKGHPYAAW
jgi:uncharacterized RDD family membrane protein YckC